VFWGFSLLASVGGVFEGFGGLSFLGLSARKTLWGYFEGFRTPLFCIPGLKSHTQEKDTPLYIYIYSGSKTGGSGFWDSE